MQQSSLSLLYLKNHMELAFWQNFGTLNIVKKTIKYNV